eukprot:CAMPEP_0204384262 /NCGR_PEP_ID=MMETSP0469-20131031/56718_1 /ASSEMBLY_ACC=CAM_ASM_000384 /TAXON_ID=2969 /ORGANISM="Oxyrrhis marina" /LENGTH=36 /DNA_ID= /DNA_START= /DNA_END= /DNA_ORIENTATION=
MSNPVALRSRGQLRANTRQPAAPYMSQGRKRRLPQD